MEGISVASFLILVLCNAAAGIRRASNISVSDSDT
nr:MAG TPA: hypothetical protein [Caudoviricetes sp.]